MGRPPAEPRPLRPEEREGLLALLGHADFEGRDALLAQVDAARVAGGCDCGCATVDLAVDAAAARCPTPIPNEATVLGDRGEPVGGVLLHTADGRLSTLEVYSNADKPIERFPPLNRLSLRRFPPEEP
jgi:hypothetical protein